MAVGINLAKKYSNKLAEAFEYSNPLAGKFSDEYKFTGVNTVIVTSIVTEALTDYSRTAAAGRYGTNSELQDDIQTMVLQRDRSFSKTVDKGNYIEQEFVKTGAKVVKAYMNEQVGPEVVRFTLGELATNAGTKITKSAVPTKDTILGMLTEIEVAMDDDHVPVTERYIAIANKYVAMLRLSLTNCDDITDQLLLKGIVGKFGSLHVIGVSEADLPTNIWAIAWQKSCAIKPQTIDDCKVTNDPVGISGMVVEGRFRYGAFVIEKRKKGVVTLGKSSS